MTACARRWIATACGLAMTKGILVISTSLSETHSPSIAQRYHRGEGEAANFVEAIRFYRLAQSRGNVQARKILELIFSCPTKSGDIDIAWMQQLAYVNLSKEGLVLDSATARRVLRREPTLLFDLVPPAWQRRHSAALIRLLRALILSERRKL